MDGLSGAYKFSGIGEGVRGARIDDEFDRAARAKFILAIAKGITGKKLKPPEGKSDGDGLRGVGEGELPIREIKEIRAAARVVGYVQVERGRASDSASGAKQ
ncbi:MAG TPA: hypothetical protein VKS20_02875 [Candidatus Acidoferrales bacterium]|nr:hypothetical protein [Candidatus Acidoferrales bacterium]